MKKAILFTIATAVLSSNLYAAPNSLSVQPANQIHWQNWPDDSQLPKGAQYAILAGNPEKAEYFVARFKFPAHYQIPLHSHLSNEYVTLLSGDLHIQLKNQTLDLKPGDFVKIPAKVEHSSWVSEEAILEESGIGPWGMIYFKNQSNKKS